MMKPLVEIKNLSIRFPEEKGIFEAVKGVSFEIHRGEILGVVGESGSGKSMSALALMGLLPKDADIFSGEILFNGRDLLKMEEDEWRKLRGSEMGMVFQEPMTSLNPVLPIGKQVGESLRLHTKLSENQIREKVEEAMCEVGLTDVKRLCRAYPHELSGGMRQRVMLAQAMVSSPSLLIADEPTTALDCVVQAQILSLLRDIHEKKGTSILFISHDLNVVRALCNRVLVVYKGEIVEEGMTQEVLCHPRHEYTRSLVARIPAYDGRGQGEREMIRLDNVNVFYDVKNGFFRKNGSKHVIHDMNLTARDGEIVGIVGESGCGKSTLCKTILGLHTNYTGNVWIREDARPQMVFQDPFGSLNPARTVGWILEEPLRLRGIRDRSERKKRVSDMLEKVGLDASFASRRPRELSGGQRQRISIGAALLMESRLLIADEPVSALDVTIQSQILELLLRIHEERKMTLLFISHDLNVVRRFCSRVMVIYKGQIVEEGLSGEVYESPAHPYTRLLLGAASMETEMEASYAEGKTASEEKEAALCAGTGSFGCAFYDRCPAACSICRQEKIPVTALGETHWVRCSVFAEKAKGKIN